MNLTHIQIKENSGNTYINKLTDTDSLRLLGYNRNINNGRGGELALFGYDSDNTYAGGFVLSVGKAAQGTFQYLIGLPNGHLSWGNSYPGNSLSDAAIVSKNIASNGYIKYASGLIIQWTVVNEFGNNQVKINVKTKKALAISWPLDSYKLIYMATLTGYEHTTTGWIYGYDANTVIIYNDGDTQGIRAHLVCIGYV